MWEVADGKISVPNFIVGLQLNGGPQTDYAHFRSNMKKSTALLEWCQQ